MPSVAQVLNPDFGRSWHECVAIVQEAATLLQPGLALPGPEDLLLDQDGTLTCGFGSESGEHPVTGLATLLLRLLDGVDAPDALRELAAESALPEPAHASVSSFTKALSFYERPNRANDLRAVAGRLRPSADRVTPDEEFERIRRKVASSADPESERVSRPRKRRARLTNAQQRVIGAGMAAGLLIGVSAVQLRDRPGLNFSGVLNQIDSKVTDVVTAGLNRLGIAAKASAAPADSPAGKPAAPESRASAARRPAAAAPRPTGETRPSESTGRQNPVPRTENRVAVLPPVPSLPRDDSPARQASSAPAARPDSAGVGALPIPLREPAAFEPSAVYSQTDLHVAPPALVRPQLPREPPPGSETGYFDLLVDETGRVEHVKLTSPRRSYHDRMLVSAAKAWLFKPASLDGRAVKYRVRIPIILPPGMP